MEEKVQKELEELKGMVLAWKESYLQAAREGGGGDFLALELLEEIEQQVYPYVRRLLECDYINRAEIDQFLNFCYRQVEDLRGSLRENRAEGQ
jgi:hypothetical protein